MRKKLSDMILILIFVVGLSLLLYPSISDYWNSIHQSRAINTYAQDVAELDNSVYTKILEEAHAYNKKLAQNNYLRRLSEDELEDYNNQIKISTDGVMSCIEIPAINCTLPIYHGTGEAVLQVAVGHIEGTSLPVGGENTHCVLSGHRGLPSAKLFSDLDQLKEGDVFMLQTLGDTLTYEVDQIRIVLPHEVGDLKIIENEDLCTLVTCTPYGINSHRLLIRGHRIENLDDSLNIRVSADAMQIDPVMVAPVLAIPVLLVLVIWVLIYYRRRN